MFPAAAALAWAVLVYIGIDFGFWSKVFDMSARRRAHLARRAEAILAATLLVFLFAYLNLNRWHVRYSHVTVGWLSSSAPSSALARVRPAGRLGHRAHVARGASPSSASCSIVYLATHGFDRAVMLIPTWFLLLVWVVAAGLTVTGHVTNDIVGAGAARRPRADRDADRLHGDAARLRRRRRRTASSPTSSAGRWR